MERAQGLTLAALLALGPIGCGTEGALVDGIFSEAEWTQIKTLSPLPALPKDTTNKYADDPAAALSEAGC